MEPDCVTSIGTFLLTFMSKLSGIFARLPVELQAHEETEGNWKKALKALFRPHFFFFQSDRVADLRYVVDYGRIVDYVGYRTSADARIHDHEDPLSEVVGKSPGPRVPAPRRGSGDPLRGFHYKPVFHLPIG